MTDGYCRKMAESVLIDAPQQQRVWMGHQNHICQRPTHEGDWHLCRCGTDFERGKPQVYGYPKAYSANREGE